MRKLVALVGLVVALALPAVAQETPGVEVFAGYAYVRSGGANLNGWNGSVAGNLNNWFGVVGDFSGHYFPPGNFNMHTYTFGPKVAYRKDRFTAFGHTLFGAARASAGFGGLLVSDTAFAFTLGGGVDMKWTENLSVRVVQFDGLITRFGGTTSGDPRLSFGVVFRFGKR